MNRTHTHEGNCQVCGRQQAADIKTNVLAKHGYTVEGGYFSGTCYGSGALPLQIERTLTDNTIRSLIRQRRDNVKTIRALRTGKRHPAKVGNYTDEYHAVRDDRFNVVEIDWKDANEYSRERGVKNAIANLEGENRFLRSHGRAMFVLAKRLHGTALVPVEIEQRAKSERKGNRAAAAAKREQLYSLKRAFERGLEEIQKIYLALPRRADNGRHDATEAQTDTYYGHPYPSQWNAKKRAAYLSAWAGNAAVAEIVAKLDAIAAEVQALK